MSVLHQNSSMVGPSRVLLERLTHPKPVGRNKWRCRCPVCGSQNPTVLSVQVLNNGYVMAGCFKCHATTADVLEALGLTWAELRDGAVKSHSPPIRVEPLKTPDATQKAKLERLCASCRPIQKGDLVARYLEGRGLALSHYPAVLRYCPALEYWEGEQQQGVYPAMVARVEHPEHGLVALHRTYLEADGQQVRKAKVSSPKKLTKPTLEGGVIGAAVRLYSPTERLALAEGIETALAVHLASGWPVWATVSAGGMARVLIPITVQEVLIAADHDPTGMEAANALAHRLLGEGKRVRIATPPKVGSDWLDIWLEEQQGVSNAY